MPGNNNSSETLLIVWSREYSVGNEKIDEQHKIIINK